MEINKLLLKSYIFRASLVKKLKNKIKSLHISIKLLLLLFIIFIKVGILSEESVFHWILLGLLMVFTFLVIIYFTLREIILTIKLFFREIKALWQYFRTFSLTGFSLKRGILSFVIIKKSN